MEKLDTREMRFEGYGEMSYEGYGDMSFGGYGGDCELVMQNIHHH